MNAEFAADYNTGDNNHLLALYEPDSVLINPSGGQERDKPQTENSHLLPSGRKWLL